MKPEAKRLSHAVKNGVAVCGYPHAVADNVMYRLTGQTKVRTICNPCLKWTLKYGRGWGMEGVIGPLSGGERRDK